MKVSDNGVGISPQDQKNVWERFFRVDGAGDHEGMGLGLALTKWIVQAHNGTIDLTSQQGVGSTFTITLPKENEKES